MNELLQQYQFLFDNMAHGAFFQDANGSLVDVNRAALEMFGLSRDQFLQITFGNNKLQVVDEKGFPLLPEQYPSTISLRSGESVRDFVAGVYNPAIQEFVWFQINSTPMFRPGEVHPYRVFVTLHNITKQKKTSEALATSEERYRAIVNTQLDLVDRYLPGGILTFVNDALCRYAGLSREKLLGKSYYDFIHEDDRQKQISSIEALTVDHPVNRTNVYAILPDGSRRWQEWTNHAIFDRDGKLVEYQAVGRDITRQKLAEEALEKSERKYRQLHEALIDGFALTDMDGTIREWNEAFRAMIDYPAEEIPHLTYRDITPVTWHDFENRILREEVIPHGFSRVYEKEYIRRDGTIFPVELRTYLLRDHRGQASGMWAIIRDISERKRMDNALRESEERYRRFIDTANEGIGITGSDYTITYVNDRLAEMLGYRTEEMIGMPVSHLLPVEERQGFDEKIAERKKGISSSRECRHQRKDGSQAWLQTSSTPIMDDNGNFQGCFAMFTDLTGRKEAEDALQQAHDELEMRVSERTADLAKANEQIKMMSFQLLRAEEQERARIAGELHDQVGQALLLAKMKLDMLASELGNTVKRTNADNISALLENSIHDIRTLTFGMRPPLLDTAGIEAAFEWLCTSLRTDYDLQIDFDCSDRPIPLPGEKRYSLFQAVRELLLNVAKHAGVSRARLSLLVRDNNLVVHVSDAGAGFEQTATYDRVTTGGGFGLFNVQQRIEQMGGSIDIRSTAGKGTTVTLSIPLEENNCPGE
ncbi:MAG TPA: PAS domain S-box protein [Geobacteraceae bacterium]|nr:PAS domain S-box protein [Geobacteraceae bacterium]